MLHLFDLRCPRPKGPAGALSSSSSGSSDGSGNGGGFGQQRVELLPRAEWALSPSPLVDLEQQDAFKGPGVRCVAAGRCDAAGGLDPYVYAGSGTGRAWVVDRRTGRVLFDWQAHGGGDSGLSGSSGSGGVGGGSGDDLGGSRHGTSSSGGTGGASGSGSGGVGSGGLGSAFHDARSLAAAVLAVRPGAARHSCVTVSSDQSALVWDLGGAAPRRVAALQGLPSVSTAGVLGAHLHSATVHVHDFVTNAGPSGLGGGGGGGSAAAAPRHRQVIFAAAGHKMSVAALPLPGATDAALPRYFYDRGGHKLQRHQLTTKACVVLPLWRMVLLGGLDDKIRVCI
jgi:hypothetical protein